MSMPEALPIACSLRPGESHDRLSWIAALNKSSLLQHAREDLTLKLVYAAEARSRVREMVRREQTCCAFLRFDLRESTHRISLSITAPEQAREAADKLLEKFVAGAPAASAVQPSCGCSVSVAQEPPGVRAAGAAAMTVSTGAVACGACCVLPFTLPATVLASTGSALSSLIHLHGWITMVSVLAVAGAWGWLAWQMRRTGRKPAKATLVMMTASTLFMAISVMWPLIEKPIIRALRA